MTGVELGTLNVTELTGVLGLAQSGVSRHLGLLKDAGLVEEEKDGGFSYYRLSPKLQDAGGHVLVNGQPFSIALPAGIQLPASLVGQFVTLNLTLAQTGPTATAPAVRCCGRSAASWRRNSSASPGAGRRRARCSAAAARG